MPEVKCPHCDEWTYPELPAQLETSCGDDDYAETVEMFEMRSALRA